MSYFDISLNNDIDFLISQIGKEIKVNNVDTRAIINNKKNNEYDDKEIISKPELTRGQYVNYNNKNWVVLNEINDKRYNSYYKAIIRHCNFDVKFTIGDRLYLFYSIIESDSFNINENKIISTSADTMTVTIPTTNITKQIKVNDRIVKFGMVWDIKGIDYTKKGLIILHCKKGSYDPNKDDLELEIADKDKLTDTTIIYPFDDVVPDEPTIPDEPVEPEPTTLNITSIETFTDVEVENGTLISDITLPSTVTVTLEDNTTRQLETVWDTSSYNGTIAGTYTLVGTITLTETITNTNNIIASINIIVKDVPEQPQEDNFTIEIQGSDNIMLMSEETYIAKVFNNGVEVDKQVIFSVNNKLANIKSQGNNQCTLSANEDFNIGDVILKATLVDDSTIFTEKQIWIKGL